VDVTSEHEMPLDKLTSEFSLTAWSTAVMAQLKMVFSNMHMSTVHFALMADTTMGSGIPAIFAADREHAAVVCKACTNKPCQPPCDGIPSDLLFDTSNRTISHPRLTISAAFCNMHMEYT
jgi:hypothetical protein